VDVPEIEIMIEAWIVIEEGEMMDSPLE